MNTTVAHISVEIPQADISLMELMAQRMGWKVTLNETLSSGLTKGTISKSLEEAKKGEVQCFSSVDDLMKDLLE